MIALFMILGLGLPAQPARVDMLLDAIDIVISPMRIVEAGLTEEYAIAMAVDANQRRYRRVRATGALGIFGSARAHAVLLDLARGDTDVEVRIQAVTSLVYAFKEAAPGGLAAELLAIAEDAPPALRRTILRQARALALPE